MTYLRWMIKRNKSYLHHKNLILVIINFFNEILKYLSIRDIQDAKVFFSKNIQDIYVRYNIKIIKIF